MSKMKNVWVDGCFDLIHYGHINLIRNAKLYGKKVIVGVHSDDDVTINKRRPIMQIQEKKFILESLKDVEAVVINAPYITSPEIMNQYSCKFCVHGSDSVVSKEGEDPYSVVKSMKRFKNVPRTETISSTEIVRRMLYPNKRREMFRATIKKYPQLIATLDKTEIFPKLVPESTVVYIAGKFELLHPALIRYFKKIRGKENYLIVGVYSDRQIMEETSDAALMNSFERGRALDACKYVDRVIINAPMKLTPLFVDSLFISKIYYGDMDYAESVRLLNYHQIDRRKLVDDNPPREISTDYLYDRVRRNELLLCDYFSNN